MGGLGAGGMKQQNQRLKRAQVVGVTCCSSTAAALAGQTFDVVLVDEASQLVEPISMMPIITGQAKYVVLAGDPMQLSPVVAPGGSVTRSSQGMGTNTWSSSSHYGRPLFERLTGMNESLAMMKKKKKDGEVAEQQSPPWLVPHLLKTQYRCHPRIAATPNTHFYEDRLEDGVIAEERPALVPGLEPVTVVDTSGEGQEERGPHRSTYNQVEADVVVRILRVLREFGVPPRCCGVICFFRAQAALIRDRVCAAGLQGEEEEERGGGGGGLQVSTVDAFQGEEKEVIILSTAVTVSRGVDGFASDKKRLNVALTRAKTHLVVVGSAAVLAQDSPALKDLIQRARSCPRGYTNGRGEFPPH